MARNSAASHPEAERPLHLSRINRLLRPVRLTSRALDRFIEKHCSPGKDIPSTSNLPVTRGQPGKQSAKFGVVYGARREFRPQGEFSELRWLDDLSAFPSMRALLSLPRPLVAQCFDKICALHDAFSNVVRFSCENECKRSTCLVPRLSDLAAHVIGGGIQSQVMHQLEERVSGQRISSMFEGRHRSDQAESDEMDDDWCGEDLGNGDHGDETDETATVDLHYNELQAHTRRACLIPHAIEIVLEAVKSHKEIVIMCMLDICARHDDRINAQDLLSRLLDFAFKPCPRPPIVSCAPDFLSCLLHMSTIESQCWSSDEFFHIVLDSLWKSMSPAEVPHILLDCRAIQYVLDVIGVPCLVTVLLRTATLLCEEASEERILKEIIADVGYRISRSAFSKRTLPEVGLVLSSDLALVEAVHLLNRTLHTSEYALNESLHQVIMALCLHTLQRWEIADSHACDSIIGVLRSFNQVPLPLDSLLFGITPCVKSILEHADVFQRLQLPRYEAHYLSAALAISCMESNDGTMEARIADAERRYIIEAASGEWVWEDMIGTFVKASPDRARIRRKVDFNSEYWGEKGVEHLPSSGTTLMNDSAPPTPSRKAIGEMEVGIATISIHDDQLHEQHSSVMHIDTFPPCRTFKPAVSPTFTANQPYRHDVDRRRFDALSSDDLNLFAVCSPTPPRPPRDGPFKKRRTR